MDSSNNTSLALTRNADVPPPLTVLVEKGARDWPRIAELLDGDSVLVLGKDVATVRKWFPAALRHDVEQPHVMIRASDLEIDLTELRVLWRKSSVDLTAQEIQILAFLARDPSRVRTFPEMMQEVWGTAFYGDKATIHSAIKRLRKKLAKVHADLRIQSVRGVGFRLVGATVAL